MAGLLLALFSMAPAAAQQPVDPPASPAPAVDRDLPLFEAIPFSEETAAAELSAGGPPGPVLPPERDPDPAGDDLPTMADCARDLLRTRL